MARAKGGARPARPVRTQPATRQPEKRSWLDGPPPRAVGYPGDRLGFPESGRGSVASQSEKLLAFLVDIVIAGIVTFLVVRPHTQHQYTVNNLVSDGVFVVLTAGALVMSGRTIGMRLLGLQVVRRDGKRMGWRSLPRQILCGLLLPAVIVNKDKRAIYDRLLNTVVVKVA
jgi:uncharacterized RDD family membrane protein YckC